MAQNSLRTAGDSPVQPTVNSSRLFFVDHLRAALVILVVLHHVALVYGASVQGYYYVEPPFDDPQAFKILLVFALVNQAWFMGAFFFLAGYFTPGSFDRKGPGSFLRDRLIRLGIPLIIFIFVLDPISNLGLYLMPSSLTGITNPPTWQAYPKLIGLGPLWFVAMLLIFSFGYTLWRALAKNRIAPSVRETSAPGYLQLGILILALALVSYLFRMIIPLGKSVSLFVDFLSFPTIAYLPQYLSFFVLGTLASRHEWLRTLPRSMGVAGAVTAVVASILLFPLAFSGQLFSLELTGALDNAMGNGHWQSAAYALWDSILAVGLCLALIPFFRRFFNRQGTFGTFLSRHSYTVYVIHIPIVVFLAYALRDIDLANVAKSGLAAVIIVPACFAAAYLVRKVPFATRVL
jgi:glucan biosynthesis protein C